MARVWKVRVNYLTGLLQRPVVEGEFGELEGDITTLWAKACLLGLKVAASRPEGKVALPNDV
jgi:hypothetical protein